MAISISGNGNFTGDMSVTGTHTLTQVPNYRNTPNIAANYTVNTTYNELSVGPITINDGVTIDISNGANWVIV